MTAAAIPLAEWQIRFHAAMAALLRAKEAIRQQAGILGVAYQLWSIAGKLRALEDVFDETLEAPDGVLEEAALRGTARRTNDLVRAIERLLDAAKTARLTNRTLTAASLESIRLLGEEIADHLDGLELSTDPEVEEFIKQGRQDFADGLGVSLDSLLSK